MKSQMSNQRRGSQPLRNGSSLTGKKSSAQSSKHSVQNKLTCLDTSRPQGTMHLSTSFGLALVGALLTRQSIALPVGEQQQPVLLEEDDFMTPIPPTQHLLQSTIRDVLIQNDIIGDVLDDFDPTYYLDISYPKSHETVLLGNDIPVGAVSSRPIFTFHSIDPTYFHKPQSSRQSLARSRTAVPKQSAFTLVLTDPDAKSRDNPKWSEMCHCESRDCDLACSGTCWYLSLTSA
jgi:hypothetical protein